MYILCMHKSSEPFVCSHGAEWQELRQIQKSVINIVFQMWCARVRCLQNVKSTRLLFENLNSH